MSAASRVCFAVVVSAAVIVLFPAGAVTAVAAREAAETKQPEFVEWISPVGFPKSSDAETKKLAKELKEKLHTIELGEGETNPVCCLWLEVSSWLPNPGQPGYVIIIQSGGGKIMATSSEQLKLAIAKLLSVSKKSGERLKFPVGLITNYPIFAPQKDAK